MASFAQWAQQFPATQGSARDWPLEHMPKTKRSKDSIGGRKVTGWSMSASGLADVWSRESTRNEICNAF